MNKKRIANISVGQILDGPFQCIGQHVAKKRTEDFSVTIPGNIVCCEGTNALLSVLPYARIAVIDGKVPQLATVAAEVMDEAGLDQALLRLGGKIDFGDVEGFTLRIGTEGSVGDAVKAAEKACGGGCEGCEADAPASLPGFLSIGATTSRSSKPIWSDAVRARIRVKGDDDRRYGVFVPEQPFALAFFDCYSEWWIKGFWSKRFTTCHGPCSVNICNCGKDKKGNRQIACDGWTVCTCF